MPRKPQPIIRLDGDANRYWRAETVYGKMPHYTSTDPKSSASGPSLCGRFTIFLANVERVTEIRASDCMNCRDTIRAIQKREDEMNERMRPYYIKNGVKIKI